MVRTRISFASRSRETVRAQLQVSDVVQTSERMSTDRGSGGRDSRLRKHIEMRDVLREKSARSAFKNIQTFLRMLEWQLMKCAGSLGFLWGDEAKGIAGRMFGDGPFFATPKPQRSSICKLTPPASRLPAALSTFRFHPSSFRPCFSSAATPRPMRLFTDRCFFRRCRRGLMCALLCLGLTVRGII